MHKPQTWAEDKQVAPFDQTRVAYYDDLVTRLTTYALPGLCAGCTIIWLIWVKAGAKDPKKFTSQCYSDTTPESATIKHVANRVADDAAKWTTHTLPDVIKTNAAFKLPWQHATEDYEYLDKLFLDKAQTGYGALLVVWTADAPASHVVAFYNDDTDHILFFDSNAGIYKFKRSEFFGKGKAFYQYLVQHYTDKFKIYAYLIHNNTANSQ